jgi:hypothetical protein
MWHGQDLYDACKYIVTALYVEEKGACCCLFLKDEKWLAVFHRLAFGNRVPGSHGYIIRYSPHHAHTSGYFQEELRKTYFRKGPFLLLQKMSLRFLGSIMHTHVVVVVVELQPSAKLLPFWQMVYALFRSSYHKDCFHIATWKVVPWLLLLDMR